MVGGNGIEIPSSSSSLLCSASTRETGDWGMLDVEGVLVAAGVISVLGGEAATM